MWSSSKFKFCVLYTYTVTLQLELDGIHVFKKKSSTVDAVVHTQHFFRRYNYRYEQQPYSHINVMYQPRSKLMDFDESCSVAVNCQGISM